MADPFHASRRHAFKSMGAPPICRPGTAISWLVPGLAQWQWGQPERGTVFLGTFFCSLAMCFFCWGNPLGWAFLGCTFLAHLAASYDVLKQLAFPVFHRAAAVSATAISLGLCVYVPVMAGLWLLAFPARSADAGASYLVNCLASKHQNGTPAPGQWVWLRPDSQQTGRAGQVIAVEGQEVEWTGRRWKVDGKDLARAHPGSLPYFPEAWRFRVPTNHVLIGPEQSQTGTSDPSPLMVVSRDQIVGRAWARCSPFWERCFL